MYGDVPFGHGAASTEEHEWEMKAGANNILVVIRARPMNEREKRICEDVVSVHEGKLVVVRDPGHFADNIMRKARIRDRKYAFDHAFDHTATQVQVYNSTTRFLIEGVVAGFNATVFAYGPTGTGKTHTMLGQRDNVGIEILTLRDLYAQVARARADGRTVTVTMSLIEVYNENLRDLLAPDAEDTDYLDLREDPVKGPCVAGVTEHDVATADDVVELLTEGNKRRTQEPTAANKESSRSHAVLQVFVQQREAYGTDVKVAKLSLIDLAGSERAANTLNRGIRLLEGANINRSLLALGNCITALVQGKGSFVPYRDSKLTRLLKDSLGGNTRTVMIGCISPASVSFEETINTLKYCDRAKRIKTNISRNVLNVNYHITEYEGLISGLRSEVTALKARLASVGVSSPHRAMSRPATASGISMTAAAFAASHGDFASALPISSSLSSRQIAAHTRPTTDARGGSRPSGLAAAGSRAVAGLKHHESHESEFGPDSRLSDYVDPAALGKLRELRQALVGNFQERMQLRRSLAELQAQNVENAVEIGRRQMMTRGDHGSAAPGVAQADIVELQRNIAANTKLKDSLLARLAENESQGEEIRLELDIHGNTEDKKELLSLEYRVCVLELEKVELEQSHMLTQRATVLKDMEIRKLKLQLKARDELLNHQASIIQQHNLSHLIDYAAVAAVDVDASYDDLDVSFPEISASAPSSGVKPLDKRASGDIWESYNGRSPGSPASGTTSYKSPKDKSTAQAAAAHVNSHVSLPRRSSLGGRSHASSPTPSPQAQEPAFAPAQQRHVGSKIHLRPHKASPTPPPVPSDGGKAGPHVPATGRTSARGVAPPTNFGAKKVSQSLAAAGAVYGSKIPGRRLASDRNMKQHLQHRAEGLKEYEVGEEPSSSRSDLLSESKDDHPSWSSAPVLNVKASNASAIAGYNRGRRITKPEPAAAPVQSKALLTRLNGAIGRSVRPSADMPEGSSPATAAIHNKIAAQSPRQIPSVSPLRFLHGYKEVEGQSRPTGATEPAVAIVPVGALKNLRSKVIKTGRRAEAAYASVDALPRVESDAKLEDIDANDVSLLSLGRSEETVSRRPIQLGRHLADAVGLDSKQSEESPERGSHTKTTYQSLARLRKPRGGATNRSPEVHNQASSVIVKGSDISPVSMSKENYDISK